MAIDKQGEFVNSMIGAKSSFFGRFMVNGTLRVDGKFEGEILRVEKLAVGKTGKVKADVEASTVEVEGIIIGNIKAKSRVMLMPTSRVLGDITTPELIIHHGVIFEGKLTITSSPDISPRK